MSLETMGLRTAGMKKQAQELIEQAYQRGYKAGRESGFDKGFDSAKEIYVHQLVEQGRNEAWEAARKLVSMGYKECNEVLGDGVLTFETNEKIFVSYTASGAIEKLREYEKRQKQDAEIHIGDEVMYHEDKGIVIREANTNICTMMGYDGSYTMNAYKHELVKTGRTFPEIAEVMKKMQEDE